MFLRGASAFLTLCACTLAGADGGKLFPNAGIRPILRHTSPVGDAPAKLPAGLNLVDWKQIRAEYERNRHGMFADGKGGFQSRSHYHGWLARFDGKGFSVKPDSEPWSWGLELEQWGRVGQEAMGGGPARMVKDVNRLTYQRRGLTEWFVNGKDGLEHGFTIAERPQGAGGEVGLQLRVRGDLVADPASSEQGISYRTREGGGALHYRKLLVTDARGRRLSARMRSKGQSIQILVDDRSAVYPVTVDPTARQAYLKASNTGTSDFFGYSVAISGDTVVVGAYTESSNATGVNGDQSNNTVTSSGAAYVFVRSGGTWSQQAYLKASNTGANDNFGRSVAISGDTVVVGARNESSNATGVNGTESDNSATGAGAAYVFVRSGGTWSQQAYLKASNTGAGDLFGDSVAISEDTVVVGATEEDSNGTGVNGANNNNATSSGAAYVFVRSGGTWSQQAYLKASNTGISDFFGYSVAISGDTVVVGALAEDSNATGVNGDQSNNTASNAGAAYVFVRSSGTWSQQAYLKASNTGISDFFGYSVAISGDTVVVGALAEDSNATGVNGTESDDSAAGAGAAYVFVRSSGTWSQQAYLKASNTGAGDNFGYSVAISGDTVVVGAYQEDSNATGVDGTESDNSATGAGAAYVFVRSGGTWSQQAYLKASNTGAGDLFGYSVAISGDTVVVGAYQEDSNATGVDGTESDNSASASGAAYVFVEPPEVTAVSPSSGPLAGGQSITITGTKFTGATSVTIGGATPISFTVVDATTITATTPAGSAGTASVVVTTPSGSNSGNTLYTYVAAPTVTAISPSSGPLAGGQSVTITGTNFTGATAVTIGGTAATSVTVVSATTITVTTPTGTAGTASVVVTTPGGSNSGNTLYTYVVAPTVTGISPSLGPLAGGQSVTITGTNFTGATAVTIGGTAATSVTVVSATTVTVMTPTGTAGTASVVVTTPSGSNSGNTLYTYVAAPTVTAISPSLGPLAGGQSVTITGTNFTGATAVTIGGTAATSVTVVDATTITATTPAGSAGTASVVVTTPSGSNSGNTLYTYVAAPTVTAISPSSGPLAGGQSVTITGTNFTGATAVTIGGTAATSVTVVSATTITVTTPTGTAGTASVVVTTPGGSNSGNTLYTYVVAPTVTGISPSSGPLAGGQSVTITGTNFTGATAVTIGGTAATSVTVVSATTITVMTPTGTAGTASVVVTTPSGSNSGNTLYTYVVAPTVTGISPSSGPLAGGQSVTITGTNFTGATAVTIGGTAATSVTVVDATTITATTPTGTAGTASVVVTTPSGSNSGNTLYTYVVGSVTFSPQLDTASAAGETGKTVAVTATPSSFSWTATSNASWLTITAGASTTGSGTVTYSVAANTSINSRTGTLTIGGQTFTVTQNGVTGAVTLGASSDTATATGATGKTVTVTATATDYAWSATANVAWLTITGGASNTGSGTVTYDVAAYSNSVTSRTGTLTIGGQTFTVTQSGVTGAVTLSPSSDTAPAAGATGKTLTATANATDYAWTATSNAAWLTITAGASTTGSGTVTYTAAANTSINSRTGTLTIGGQTFTVTQNGLTGAVTLSPTSYTAPVSGVAGRSITVTSNATDFAWTATANVPWLTITGGASGTGNGTVTYNVAANGGGERTGTLTVGGKTFVVSQGTKPEIVLPQTRIEASFATGEKVTPLMVVIEGPPGLGITVRSLVPWLEVTPNPLTLPGKLTITPSAQLKPGNYVGVIVLQAEGVDPVFVYIRLTATEPPQFIPLPAAIQLEGSSTGVLYITSRGRQVRYEAEAVSEGGWLSVTPENGMTPVNLRVTANTYFLKPGVHTGTVRVITREPGGGGPVTIPVTVTVPEKGQ